MSSDLGHPLIVSAGCGDGAIRQPGSVSVGWTLTGYAMPNQAQFPGTATITVTVGDGGRGITGNFIFTSGFLSSSFINGTGSVSGGASSPNGWYLNTISWDQVSTTASGLSVSGGFGADGYLSVVGNTVAMPITSSGGFPFGTQIIMPTLASALSTLSPSNRFAEHDRGGFVGQHIDIFCGEGSGAFAASFAVTIQGPTQNLGCRVIRYYRPAGADPPPIVVSG